VLAQEKVQLAILPSGAQWELSWPASLVLPGGVSALPSYQVQRSDDLNTWTDVGPKLRGDAATSGNPLPPHPEWTRSYLVPLWRTNP